MIIAYPRGMVPPYTQAPLVKKFKPVAGPPILPAPPITTITRLAEDVARITAICEKCDWQINWICEHSGCRPCKQRSIGGLKVVINQPYSTCPANKW